MEVKLYVGNMSYETTEDQLRGLFAEAGSVVSVDVIKDRDTGSSKGFAFVTMASQAEATKAISLMDGKEIGGRPLKVNAARPREDRPSYGRSSSGPGNRKRSGGGGGGGGWNNRY